MKIVFFGTPEFAATSLLKIHEAGFHIVGVITAPDKPAGRGQKINSSAVKIMAEQLNLPVYQPKNLKSEECQDQLKAWQPDLGVVIAFRMLPSSVWGFPQWGTINLHASLLPNYRGAAPIQHVLINGEKLTGNTTFFLKHEIDTGDIIDQQEIPITEEMNSGELHDILMKSGSELVIKSLRKIEKFGRETPTIPQVVNLSDLKMAPKLTREFCEITDLSDINTVYNMIRGLSPYPGAWIKSEWGDMKIFKAQKVNHMNPVSLGLEIQRRKLLLNTVNGILILDEIQLPGKSKMKSSDFLNGILKKK